MAEPIVSGELVVRNGRRAGSRFPLTLPVTVVGGDDRCDIRLTAPGVGGVHCLVTATPDGLAVRSWHPDQTFLNGERTAAAVLADGDELRVGPCVFQVRWASAEETLSDAEMAAAKVRADAADVAARKAAVTEQEWHLRDRACDLHEQETRLAAILEDRQKQFADLQAGLAAGRDRLRTDRAADTAAMAAEREKLRRMTARVRPLHAAARKDRQKARALLGRFLEHLKRRTAAQRQTAAAERAGLDQARRSLADQTAAFEADQARFRAEAAAYQTRLKDAWELLTDGQRRLLADREQAEATLAERNALTDARTRDVEAREQALADGRAAAEARVRELVAEGDRLEARAIRGREVLAELEAKRGAVEAGLAARSEVTAVAVADVVHMDRRADGASVDRVFAELQLRDRDLTRERHQLAAVRAELDRRAADLADERAVVAEQVAMLTVVRDRLNADQRQALVDLEAVARSVHARELAVFAAEHRAAADDRRNRKREAELAQFRLRLDAWQASLTAHEQTAGLARDHSAAALAALRGHLTRWEGSLTTLCGKWTEARRRERVRLHDEIAGLAAARAKYEAGWAALVHKRDEILAQAATVASLQLAAEQEQDERTAAGRTPTRRLRVLRRKWESRFTQLRDEIDDRRTALRAEAAAAEARVSGLHKTLKVVEDRRAAAAAEEQAVEAARQVRERELDQRAAMLAAEVGRAEQAEAALAAVRDEVDRVAAAVITAGPDTLALPPADELPRGVIALRRAA